ncbi:MAG: hypothetical protein OEV85_09075 [Candidatus Thorarchaeota archaeon]|nr:hypothetical protein [Candidatus Thorarchaeota archaeon]
MENEFIDNLTLDSLTEFPKLQTLRIVGGRYENIELKVCNEMKSLSSFIIVDNTKIKEIDIRPLLDNPRVKNIELSVLKQLRNILMDNIHRNESLQTLILLNDREYENEFCPDLSLISKCKSLQKLVITTNEKQIDLSMLIDLRNLVRLTIIHHVETRWLAPLDDHPLLYDLPVIDGTPLLGMSKLIEFNYQIRGIYSHVRNLAGRIKLPVIVSSEIGDEWYRMQKYPCYIPPTIVYANIDESDWTEVYRKLQRYASLFSPTYWSSFNKYLLKMFNVDGNVEGIDIAKCVLPSDLFRLVKPDKSKSSNAKSIKAGINEHIHEMIEEYLNSGNSTAGFDIDFIRTNNTRFISLVPKIEEMRDEEVKRLTFYELSPDDHEYEEWLENPRYYVHSLRDTVYGKQVVKDIYSDSKGNIIPRYVMSLSEILEIEEHFNASGIITDWEFIGHPLWTTLMY